MSSSKADLSKAMSLFSEVLWLWAEVTEKVRPHSKLALDSDKLVTQALKLSLSGLNEYSLKERSWLG